MYVCSDVRIERLENVPLGFIPITKTASGRQIDINGTVVCFKRNGLARIKQIGLLVPARDKVQAPANFLVVRSNINDADSDEAFVCISKGASHLHLHRSCRHHRRHRRSHGSWLLLLLLMMLLLLLLWCVQSSCKLARC